MILNFRVEAEAERKQEAIDEATLFASQTMRVLEIQGQRGEWECTDDVAAKSRHGYKVRMKFVYRG